jgi:hypothetical protein
MASCFSPTRRQVTPANYAVTNDELSKESEIERAKDEDDTDIGCESFPKPCPVPEKQEIDADHYDHHDEHIEHTERRVPHPSKSPLRTVDHHRNPYTVRPHMLTQ